MVKKRGQINLLIYLTPFLNHVFFFKVSHLVSNLLFRPIRKPYFPKNWISISFKFRKNTIFKLFYYKHILTLYEYISSNKRANSFKLKISKRRNCKPVNTVLCSLHTLVKHTMFELTMCSWQYCGKETKNEVFYVWTTCLTKHVWKIFL